MYPNEEPEVYSFPSQRGAPPTYALSTIERESRSVLSRVLYGVVIGVRDE